MGSEESRVAHVIMKSGQYVAFIKDSGHILHGTVTIDNALLGFIPFALKADGLHSGFAC